MLMWLLLTLCSKNRGFNGTLTALQRNIMKQISLCPPLRVEVEDDSETPSHLVGYSRKPHLVELKHTLRRTCRVLCKGQNECRAVWTCLLSAFFVLTGKIVYKIIVEAFISQCFRHVMFPAWLHGWCLSQKPHMGSLCPPLSSGHCYYQTIVTPVSLPDSPCSRIPHTVTLVSIPALAEGNNGRRGRGFSVAIDQPPSPTNGYSPENGHTVRVSELVRLLICVCAFVCVSANLCRFPGHHESFKGLSWRLLDYF